MIYVTELLACFAILSLYMALTKPDITPEMIDTLKLSVERDPKFHSKQEEHLEVDRKHMYDYLVSRLRHVFGNNVLAASGAMTVITEAVWLEEQGAFADEIRKEISSPDNVGSSGTELAA